jgi:NAD-reducing hydrogenase large subunit
MNTKEIIIDPVTRIEGHSKITIRLDNQGEVEDAQFHGRPGRDFQPIRAGRPCHKELTKT